ncbi:hypothetical protein Tco_1080330 [Tanacetum coccineum]|uniref:Uncharacterized protein n=1 Tax=Tanacetum coccineum TaxID=301880 RepID=A0ABQ5HVY9_9ASTR
MEMQGRSSDKTKPMFKDNDFDVLDAKQITTTGPSHVSTTDQVSTARPEVSAATPSTPPTTATVFDDEDVTMAMTQTLINMKLDAATPSPPPQQQQVFDDEDGYYGYDANF